MSTTIQVFQERLLAWYAEHKRDLPWRQTHDPYAHLVAEVMLQQTGVERVAPKFVEFLGLFPTFAALAEASSAAVIRAWSPLGYNRRALNLHKAAIVVVAEHDGHLPNEMGALRSLPGVGPYTASALLSFAFGEDVAAIDTNIDRVLGRVLIGPESAKWKGQIAGLAAEALPKGRSADWNQALMDLGAMVCRVASPKCGECPASKVCVAAETFVEGERPLRRVAEAQSPYVGSNRYYRGRVIDALRRLAPGSSMVPGELGLLVKDGFISEDLPWLLGVLAELSREGLVVMEGETTVSLPE